MSLAHMFRVRFKLYRLAAIALLAWMSLGAVAAPLTACCGDAEPCCVLSLSGHGCIGCASTPAVDMPAHVVRLAPTPAGVPEMAVRTYPEHVPVPPWKPPDGWMLPSWS